MPADYRQIVRQVLSGTLPQGVQVILHPVAGGSINDTFRVSTTTSDGPRWFCKINHRTRFPGLFQKEADGLVLLGRQSNLRVPDVVACAEVDDFQLLILDYIGEGSRTPAFWKHFGEQLAALHRVSHPTFGLSQDNYMGSLSQDNTPSPDWADFFLHRRLEPLVRIASNRHLLDLSAVGQFTNLFRRLSDIFPPEPPALLHGDLWSGNFLCDAHSRPVLIDPAVYYGHRSIDLAMTTLFGGFDRVFYDAYEYNYPLPPNYREQWAVSNLYPLLIHLNLFGQSYLSNILHTIRGF